MVNLYYFGPGKRDPITFRTKMRHYVPKKDRNIALLTSILMKKVPYFTILNKSFKYSRAGSGLYIDKTIM